VKGHRWLAYTALASVCFFWGTTYLGIRMALESLSPAWLVSIRYMLSGALLTGVALARGARVPRGKGLWTAIGCGVLILGGGNGTLAFAETIIPSGLASLFITTSPFWMVGVEALLPGGEGLHGPTIAGMFVGFGGTALLLTTGIQNEHVPHAAVLGFLILQVGVVTWTFGSILQRRAAIDAHPAVTGAIQQLAVGLIYLPVALLTPYHHPIVWHTRAVLAVIYLALFGSIVGYSSYMYALENLPVAVTSVYPYVNCGVAVALGWLFYREPFGWREATGMAIIFVGVAIVRWATMRRKAQAEACVLPLAEGVDEGG
jgi:drug/metabolite transporter (DMT)-like permease